MEGDTRSPEGGRTGNLLQLVNRLTPDVLPFDVVSKRGAKDRRTDAEADLR